MKKLLTPALLLALVSAAHAGPISRADKDAVIAWAMSFLADPYSLRSTGISEPVVIASGATVVCVEFNARNQVGGYVGIDRMPFVQTPSGLRPGIRGLGGTTNGTCFAPEFRMRPFPELANIR